MILLDKIRGLSTPKLIVAGVVIVSLVLGVMYWGYSARSAAKLNEAKVKAEAAQLNKKSAVSEEETPDGLDKLLIDQQPSLREKYGTPKDGFIWDIDGTLLSLGDKSMQPEEVVYTYLRALNTLDFSTAERTSRRTSVVNTYADFFDTTTSSTLDYKDQFKRVQYRQALVSLQVESVERSANFSDNRQVFTIKGKMIDQADKSFWEKDRNAIFKTLRTYTKSEEDTVKAETYLYDYITAAYDRSIKNRSQGINKKEDIPLKNVSFDLTIQRYPAQDSGWLVSIDKDLDLLCKYADGVSVADHIQEQFRQYLLQDIK